MQGGADVFFGNLNEQNDNLSRPDRPIWSFKFDGEDNDKILQWLRGERDFLREQSRDNAKRIERNLALYQGIQYQGQAQTPRDEDGETRKKQAFQKIVVNDYYDLTQNRMSRVIKYKPAVAILPSNDEFEDKIGAQLCKMLLDNIWYVEKFEGEVSVELIENTMVMGEAFLFILWNPDKGDVHPDYLKAKARGEEMGKGILVDDNGDPITNEDGEPIEVNRVLKTGDVDYQNELATNVLLEKAQRWEDCNYLFRKRVYTVDEAKVRYPKAAHLFKQGSQAQVFDYDSLQLKTYKGFTEVWEFYHKRHPMIEDGLWLAFNDEGLIFHKRFPYTHYNLPCVRMTDIDFPGQLHGRSFLEMVKGPIGASNNLTNMILRNQMFCSHPKWMMPAGAAKREALGNDITIVEFKGPLAPQLVTGTPTPREVFGFRQQCRDDGQRMAGIQGVSRGEPPVGIKAGVALQFLSEQEAERQNKLILKWNEAIRQIAVMTMAVCGDYYDESDARMIRVIGKNNRYMTVFFDVQHLSKQYDVRMQNSSALPQSKAARMQTLLDLNQQFPNQLPPSQVLEMLDMAQDEKFLDLATRSVRAAEAEVEAIMSGSEVKPPEDYEDHISHWQVKVGAIRAWGFKNSTPMEIQQRMIDVITAHEMFMYQKGKQNPMYLQEVMTKCPGAPLFFVPAEMIEPEPMDETAPQVGAPMPAGVLDEMQAQVQPPMGPMQIPPGASVNPDSGPTGQGEPAEVAPPMPNIDQQTEMNVPPIE